MSQEKEPIGYPDIKFVTIRGKPFAIRRFTDADDEQLMSVAKDNVAYKRTVIFLGLADPKLKSIDEVKEMDREVTLGLFLEIEEFNSLNRDFLLRLRNLPSLASPLLETNVPLMKLNEQ